MNRKIQYDLLRVIACFMVVMLHVSAFYWTKLSPSSKEWQILNIYDSFVRSSVALFFMISGTFLLTKEVTLKKLYQKNILHLFVVLIVWSVLYAIDTLGFPAFFKKDLGSIFTAVVNGKYHLWFLWSIIGIYIFVPVLYAITHYQEGKYMKYFLLLFLIFGVLRSTLIIYPYPNRAVFDLIKKLPNMSTYAGYFVLGYYLDQKVKKKLNGALLLGIYIFIVGCSAVIGRWDAMNKMKPAGLLYGYFCLPVFIEAILLFLLLKGMEGYWENKEKVSKVIYFFSQNTMGIYLLHPFVLERLDRYEINSLTWNTWISVPLVTVLTFGCCLIISVVLSKIPLVRKLI